MDKIILHNSTLKLREKWRDKSAVTLLLAGLGQTVILK